MRSWILPNCIQFLCLPWFRHGTWEWWVQKHQVGVWRVVKLSSLQQSGRTRPWDTSSSNSLHPPELRHHRPSQDLLNISQCGPRRSIPAPTGLAEGLLAGLSNLSSLLSSLSLDPNCCFLQSNAILPGNFDDGPLRYWVGHAQLWVQQLFCSVFAGCLVEVRVCDPGGWAPSLVVTSKMGYHCRI